MLDPVPMIPILTSPRLCATQGMHSGQSEVGAACNTGPGLALCVV